MDIRSNTQIYSNKKHDAGVTWLYKYNDNNILSAGYDGRINLWDERNMKNKVEIIILKDKSLWDIKFYQ